MTLTTETVAEILARKGADQIKSAKSALESAVRDYDKARKAGETATLTASLATYMAEQTGLLPPKGQRVPGGEGGDMLTGAKYAEKFGVGGSTVTMWRTCGYVVEVVGVDPSEESTTERMSLWRLLAFKGAATNKAVSEAIYAEGATPETVREAVEAIRDGATGKVKSGARTGTPNRRTGGENDLTLDEAIALDPVAVSLAMIRDLRTAARACDADGWSQVETALNALIHREITQRNAKSSKARREEAEAALDDAVPEVEVPEAIAS